MLAKRNIFESEKVPNGCKHKRDTDMHIIYTVWMVITWALCIQCSHRQIRQIRVSLVLPFACVTLNVRPALFVESMTPWRTHSYTRCETIVKPCQQVVLSVIDNSSHPVPAGSTQLNSLSRTKIPVGIRHSRNTHEALKQSQRVTLAVTVLVCYIVT